MKYSGDLKSINMHNNEPVSNIVKKQLTHIIMKHIEECQDLLIS